MAIRKGMLGQEMLEVSPQQRINVLRHLIRCHSYLYHTLADPIIRDGLYDLFYKNLQELEAEHPELITEDSPTQLAGAERSLMIGSPKTKAEVIKILRSYFRPQE